MLFDLHMHTTFSDGKDSPEEMVLSAIEKGLGRIGISDHSHTPFDESYCIRLSDIDAYKAEVGRLKEKYANQIEVLCGIEQDLYSDVPADVFDYHILSVHYIRSGEKYYPVDESPEDSEKMVEVLFGGDWYAAAEAYFAQYALVKEADIIGHFDLFCKFNEQKNYFDENHPRYTAAWKKAADSLLENCSCFEINTGAISRGYKTDAYPSAPIRAYLKSKGAKFILSSDAHSADNICFGFGKYSGCL